MSNIIIGEGVVKVLQNGVEVMDVQIENNLELAQHILDHNPYAEKIDVWSAYNNRKHKELEGTYKIKIARKAEYARFLTMLDRAKCQYGEKRSSIISQYHNDVIEHEEAIRQIKVLEDCQCDVCQIQKPTFEEWKVNSITVEEFSLYNGTTKARTYKLGKYLNKCGVPQDVIDFYSQQIKEESEMFLTITSAPQFVAGMSFYAEEDSWDGAGGTSCQDTRRDDDYPFRLGGALHDNMLHVAMLHEKLDDLHDMTDKLLARVNMRPVSYAGKIVLIPTRYYGNNKTKDQLDYALKQLEEIGVYNIDITIEEHEDDRLDRLAMHTTGGYTMYTYEDVEFEETIDEYVSCECPACNGHGNLTRTFSIGYYEEVEHTFECPACNGSGEYEVYVYEEISKSIEIERDETIHPYHEHEGNHYRYMEYDNSYSLRVNVSKLARDFIKYNRV